MKKIYSVFLICLLLLLIVACKPKTTDEILSGTDSCKPPCWLSIQPGKTELSEVTRILLAFEKSGEGTYTLLNTGTIRWRSSNEINVYFKNNGDDFVSVIDLDFRPSSIKLDDVINIFGEPTFVSLGNLIDGYYTISIYYPDKGLAFGGADSDVDTSKDKIGYIIQPETIIMNANFFQPTDNENMVNVIYGPDIKDPAIDIQIQPWIGYGIYQKQ